jgi:hypothetical protein
LEVFEKVALAVRTELHDRLRAIREKNAGSAVH